MPRLYLFSRFQALIHPRWKTGVLFLLCPLFSGWVQANAPEWVAVNVVWETPAGTQRLSGQLEFQTLPVTRLELGGFGITNLVPLAHGEIQIQSTEQTHEGHPVFELTDYQGTHPFHWDIPAIPVQVRDEGMRGVEIGAGFTSPAPVQGLSLEEEAPAATDAESDEEPAGLRLIPEGATQVTAIPIHQLRSIHFQALADGGFRRESYTGRFVSYSRGATGDEGRVRPLAATFLGGEADEHLSHGGFFSDGRIFVAGMFHDPDFLDDLGVPVRVLGNDNAVEDYPPEEGTDRRGRPLTRYPAETPVVFVLSADLSRIEDVIRLPWAGGAIAGLTATADDGLLLAIRAREATDRVVSGLGSIRSVAHPDAVTRARERATARATEPQLPPHAYLIRLSMDRTSGRASEPVKVDWAVRFEHAGIHFSRMQSGRLVVRRDQDVFFIQEGLGEPQAGPRVEHGRSHSGMVVDPRDGSFFFGGEYHSHTGLEPWRCPFLRKFDPEGKPLWSAYDWTGPIVGVQFSRLVSDSAVMDVLAGENGRLLLRGWSDGGNSVFTRQPYDLRAPVPVGGTASSIWGANVLSVSYLIQMNADTMDVYGVTRLLSYLPTSNTPNSISIRSFHQMENGQVALFGGSAFGLIETHDAWVTPWYLQYQTNRHAQARGGPFLALYEDGLQQLRLSTIFPGVHRVDFASQGDRLLIFGSTAARNNSYGDLSPAILKHALQPEFGGGSRDAYIMLVDTAADPLPPQIPERTW